MFKNALGKIPLVILLKNPNFPWELLPHKLTKKEIRMVSCNYGLDLHLLMKLGHPLAAKFLNGTYRLRMPITKEDLANYPKIKAEVREESDADEYLTDPSVDIENIVATQDVPRDWEMLSKCYPMRGIMAHPELPWDWSEVKFRVASIPFAKAHPELELKSPETCPKETHEYWSPNPYIKSSDMSEADFLVPYYMANVDREYDIFEVRGKIPPPPTPDKWYFREYYRIPATYPKDFVPALLYVEILNSPVDEYQKMVRNLPFEIGTRIIAMVYGFQTISIEAIELAKKYLS